jgi:hypothetical protein
MIATFTRNRFVGTEEVLFKGYHSVEVHCTGYMASSIFIVKPAIDDTEA